jgi:hypothetical protein
VVFRRKIRGRRSSGMRYMETPHEMFTHRTYLCILGIWKAESIKLLLLR